LQYQPLEIAPALPTGSKPPGTLIIEGYGRDPSYFINFAQGSVQEILKDRSCFSTSPNGQWLAYCQGPEPFVLEWLIIESANGEQMARLPINIDWFFGSPDWLDNQRLVFDLWKDKSKPLLSVLPVEVVNPFTGERQELASDYPDLFPSNAGPGGSTMYFVTHTVVYHPSLDLVVYPKTPRDNNRAFVVLWDRKANHEVASVGTGLFGHTPMWSPDGAQFVVAIVTKAGELADDDSEFIEEWFSVSREGKVQQLTHFGDYFSDVEIGRARWSPDGQYLAFFLTTKPTQCDEGENLSVMDMKTWQVTNYCVPGVMGIGGPSPIWSPDSRYVAFNDSVSTNPHVVIVDIEQGWAAQIAGDLYPMGWLTTP
jgi:hypothetical protein